MKPYWNTIYEEAGVLPLHSRAARHLRRNRNSYSLTAIALTLLLNYHITYMEKYQGVVASVKVIEKENEALRLSIEALRGLSVEPKAVLVVAQDSQSLYQQLDGIHKVTQALRETKQRKAFK